MILYNKFNELKNYKLRLLYLKEILFHIIEVKSVIMSINIIPLIKILVFQKEMKKNKMIAKSLKDYFNKIKNMCV